MQAHLEEEASAKEMKAANEKAKRHMNKGAMR